MERRRALVVEDDPAIVELVRLYLERDGFAVTAAGSVAGATAALAALHPVVMVLDVGLPDGDGTDLCRRMRAAGDSTPVLFVTARDDEVDRVLGLELGGDDYLTKPFSPRELVARVRTVLRRVAGPQRGAAVLEVGAVRLDPQRRRVWADGGEVALTTTEFRLLAHLMARPGRVHERAELLTAVWGHQSVAGTRTVDVHVAQLRAKLGPHSPLRTVRGVGYAAEPS